MGCLVLARQDAMQNHSICCSLRSFIEAEQTLNLRKSSAKFPFTLAGPKFENVL